MAKKAYSNAVARKASVVSTPPSRPVPGREKEMIKNDAGGWTFKIGPFKMLERFLILGTEGGTYYATEKAHTERNIKSLDECIRQDYVRTVDLIVDISLNGRAPHNDEAIFALARVASCSNEGARRYALSHLSDVCRIGTHLFQFFTYIKSMRGFGRAVRNAVQGWYLGRSDMSLATQLAKYQSRDGVSHRDVLLQAHVRGSEKVAGPVKANLLRWSAKGTDFVEEDLIGLPKAHMLMRSAKNEDQVINIITDYKVPRELVPTEYLKSAGVWRAMLPNMGAEAMIRNLGNMTSYGVFQNHEALTHVMSSLSDPEWIKSNRLHPIKSLVAYLNYKNGKGMRGSNSWNPITQLVHAIENAFYLGFKAVQPTNKRFMYTLDVSGSMTGGAVAGVEGLTPLLAESALCLVTLNTESFVAVTGFSNQIIHLPISRGMTINEAMNVMRRLEYGSTDASLPFRYAQDQRIDVDAFIMTTDSESWTYSWGGYGRRESQHPFQALNDYRQKVGHDVKLVTIAMTATGSSIGDQSDENALDVVGFDTAVPELIEQFVK